MEASAAGETGATGTRGQIGRQTFDMARELISEGKKPTEAFTIVAERTGRSAATVATAYYRIARTIPGGAGVKQRSRSGRSTPAAPRAARAAKAPAARRGGGSGSTTSQLVQQLVAAATALSDHVERLERENAEYRTITAALDRLKRS